MEAVTVGALVAISLVAGVGITTVGPGGILVTVALYALLPIDASTVAGTATTTFVATGVVGTAVYLRSGELRIGENRETAAVLSATGVAGALAGAAVNLRISDAVFGALLAGFVFVVGCVLLYRELCGLPPRELATGRRRTAVVAGLGAAVGFVGGLLGVGGPVLAVPLLVLAGVGMLPALAVAQVQSVFLSGAAAGGYLLAGAVDWWLVVLVGVPEVVGVVAGWRIAHRVPAHRLRLALGAAMVGVSALLVF